MGLSFEVKIRTNTAKFTNMIITRFRGSRYLVRESEVQSTEMTPEISRGKVGPASYPKKFPNKALSPKILLNITL